MTQLTWKTEKRKTADLIPASYNPRKLTDKQRADLVASIKEFGEVEPVVINTNGTIVGGHQRIKIYTDLGLKEIVVRVPNRKLNASEEKRLNLRLNRNNGEWDWSLLGEFEQEMLLDVGFTEDELLVNLGLSDAEDQEIDLDRLGVLMVYPPESPKLKERIGIYCGDIQQYRKIKKAVEAEVINVGLLMEIIENKK